MIKDYGLTKDFIPKFTITNRITTGLPRIERARDFLAAAKLSENWGCTIANGRSDELHPDSARS
jgi:hypothetical protein